MRTVQQVKNEIEEIDRKLNEGVPADKAHVLRMDKAALEDELREIEQVQELPTEETSAFETDGLLEQIADLKLFEAIEPEPADGERLHEYDERRKEHNLIIYIFTKEKEEAKDKHYQGIIKQKDDDYLDLLGRHQKQIIYQTGVEEENETLKSDYQTELLRVEGLEETVKLADQENERLQDSIETLEYNNGQLLETIAKLESQIEASKRTEVTSSADLQERVANLKAKTKTADDFMKQYFERNNMALPDLSPPALVNEVNEAETFQEDPSAETSLPSTEQGSEQQDCSSDEPTLGENAEPETFEEEVRRRLTTLELKVNKNDPEFFHEVA